MAQSQDWRLLRVTALYRLLAVTALLLTQEWEFAGRLFPIAETKLFHGACLGYALMAMLLMLAIFRRRPSLAWQVPVSLGIDIGGMMVLTAGAGGLHSGLGMLLIPPVVGSAMLSSPRMAMIQASVATGAIFSEEIIRTHESALIGADFTEAGILGLIIFTTTLAATLIAARVRGNEALIRRAGSDLANMTQLNERILESMDTGVLVTNQDGTIRTANAAARALLRRSGKLEGAPLDVLSPALAKALTHWRRQPISQSERLVTTADEHEISVHLLRIGYSNEAPTLMLLEPAERLREQAQQIKLAALGRLSAGIAHEIRNPLSAIRHAGQLLSESSSLDDENQRLLNMIERHSLRLDRIVASVLNLSRGESRNLRKFSLLPYLVREIAAYREAATVNEQRTINIASVDPGLLVQFDPQHLQQTLHNLWDNSFEHASKTGRAVTVSLTAGRLAITRQPFLDISDDGSGIPPAIAEKVFEPFFTTASTGTGLGLYLARELCEYNGARLIHRRVDGDGACFRLLFANT